MNVGGVDSSSADAEGNGVNETVVKETDGGSPGPASGANDGPCPAFLEFMKCDLVVDQLMQHLNFKDMKAFSSVSKDMLVAVRSSREFAKRSRFEITKDLLSSGVDLENLCNYLFKRISFDLSLPLGVIDLVSDKLEYIQSLLLDHDPQEESEEQNYSEIAQGCVRIHEILRRTTNLRELEIEATYLTYSLGEIFSSRNVQQTISNLESLIVRLTGCWLEDDELTTYQDNLLQLSRSPLKLKKLVIPDTNKYYVRFDTIPKLIKACKETLEEMELVQNIWNLEEMELIRCPKLRRLTVTLWKDVEIFARFVQSQNVLDDLRVKATATCSTSKLLEWMEGRLPNVRKLTIVFWYFPDDDDEEQEVLDWKFLVTMTKLEEFTAVLPGNVCAPDMIACLPRTVKKVEVSLSIDPKCEDFWSGKRSLEDFSPNIGDYLSHLKDLTHFSLLNCNDAINDVGLQTIIRTCQNLKVLRFEDCPNLSDFGISGVTEDEREPGVPLSHLKGLVELDIGRCDLLSTRCVLNVIRFKNLRRFSFDTLEENRIEDKEQCVTQLREQNPSLVSFRHNGTYWI